MSNPARIVSACLFVALFHGSQFALPQLTQQPTDLQNSGLAEARVTVLNGKTAVLLRTGNIIKRKHADSDEEIGTVYLESFEGERAISFPAVFFCRQALLYGQVGACSTGQLLITDRKVVYQSDKGKTGFLSLRSATVIKSEGGREGDTFSLYDQKGTRYRFGNAKFDSPFMRFLCAAIAAFPQRYDQAQMLAAEPGPTMRDKTESVATVRPVATQPNDTVAEQTAPVQAAQADVQTKPTQEQMFQQPAQDDSDRQQRIQQLKNDIEMQQNSAVNWDKSVQDMTESTNNNCTMGGLTAVLCRGTGAAGIAKARKEAAKARNQLAADQEELERLEGLEVQQRPKEDATFGGNFQQAASQIGMNTQRINSSAATAAASETSNPQEGPTQQDGSTQPSYEADRHYDGSDSNWVKTLLTRNGDWSCPTNLSQTNTATGFASQAKNVCMRDSYVWAAVLEAWGAECESRFSRDQVAAQDAASMKENLRNAAKLCSNAPVFGPGPECGTAKIVTCDELAPLKGQ